MGTLKELCECRASKIRVHALTHPKNLHLVCHSCEEPLNLFAGFYCRDAVDFFGWLDKGERAHNILIPCHASKEGYAFANVTQHRVYYLHREAFNPMRKGQWDLNLFKKLSFKLGLPLDTLLSNLPRESFRHALFTVGVELPPEFSGLKKLEGLLNKKEIFPDGELYVPVGKEEDEVPIGGAFGGFHTGQKVTFSSNAFGEFGDPGDGNGGGCGNM